MWNHYKISAVDNTIRVWINGTLITDFNDGRTKSGYIGLQVHSIGNDETKKNKNVIWKNLEIKDFGNTLWFASEEDEINSLQHTSDNDEHTAWTGKELTLDFQNTKKRRLIFNGNLPITISYTKDDKSWVERTIDAPEIILPDCRKIKITPQLEKLVIRELSVD
ncbi:MAG: DUF1080 domain-containing protein [Saprospiraceae bacterium]|nr:DUF1080 domain-containing protein [Saprospiraceae bacterium]